MSTGKNPLTHTIDLILKAQCNFPIEQVVVYDCVASSVSKWDSCAHPPHRNWTLGVQLDLAKLIYGYISKASKVTQLKDSARRADSKRCNYKKSLILLHINHHHYQNLLTKAIFICNWCPIACASKWPAGPKSMMGSYVLPKSNSESTIAMIIIMKV